MQLPDTDLARCPFTVTDGSVDIRLHVPHWLLPHGVVCGCVRSSANCLAFTNFFLSDVPVFLTKLKMGFCRVVGDDILDPDSLALVVELDVPEKLLVLLRAGSKLCTESTRSWSLPNVEMTRTAGSGDLGTRMSLLEVSNGVRRLSKLLTFSLMLSTIFLG